MRNLYEVIEKMIEIIPEENNSLISQLKDIQASVSFAAPELRSFWWNECANTLNSNIVDITEDWQIKLGSIFSGNS
jgi:hypothetical protein